jgi:NAD(P)-dependent dehydrogenase (short-subunit alcohol dehydrogenase family)
MESLRDRTALVTGANRGLGYEVARQLAAAGLWVILGCRSEEVGLRAARTLRAEGLNVVPVVLDVADAASVTACAAALDADGIAVDVLVNNAGIYLEHGLAVWDIEERHVRAQLEVNLFGPFRTMRAFLPDMIDRGYGRIVNVSSSAGVISEPIEAAPGYALGKVALNMWTRRVARALPSGDVKINAVDPGSVRTDLNPTGKISPSEAADTVVWLATLPTDGPSDGFFSRRVGTPW